MIYFKINIENIKIISGMYTKYSSLSESEPNRTETIKSTYIFNSLVSARLEIGE